jgi:hypothetical protein
MGFKKVSTYISYNRQGDYIEIKLKNMNETIDVRTFDIETEQGQRSFFEYASSKLGMNFKKYQREKEGDYF